MIASPSVFTRAAASRTWSRAHHAPVVAPVGGVAGGVQAGAAGVIERAGHVEALRDDDGALDVEDAPRPLRGVPRVEAGVVGEDVLGRDAAREQDPAHRADLVVLPPAVVAGEQELVDAAGLVELGGRVDPVGEHRAGRAVGHHLGAEHERGLRVRDLARVGRDRAAAAGPDDQVRHEQRDDEEPGGDGEQATHARSVAGERRADKGVRRADRDAWGWGRSRLCAPFVPHPLRAGVTFRRTDERPRRSLDAPFAGAGTTSRSRRRAAGR